MAFKFINKQGVESDAGFVVQFTGRFTLVYVEGNFRMECPVDGNEIEIAVDLPEMPYGNIDNLKLVEIAQRIRESLKFMGLNPIVS